MLHSMSPQCCEAAAQSNLGNVGRPTTKSLMEANSWSPLLPQYESHKGGTSCTLSSRPPKSCPVPAGKVGDCGEVYFGAESGEEYMLVDKKVIYCQFDILLELDELLGNLDNTLCHMLAIPLDCILFHLEDRSAPDYICGFDIVSSHV